MVQLYILCKYCGDINSLRIKCIVLLNCWGCEVYYFNPVRNNIYNQYPSGRVKLQIRSVPFRIFVCRLHIINMNHYVNNLYFYLPEGDGGVEGGQSTPRTIFFCLQKTAKLLCSFGQASCTEQSSVQKMGGF